MDYGKLPSREIAEFSLGNADSFTAVLDRIVDKLLFALNYLVGIGNDYVVTLSRSAILSSTLAM